MSFYINNFYSLHNTCPTATPKASHHNLPSQAITHSAQAIRQPVNHHLEDLTSDNERKKRSLDEQQVEELKLEFMISRVDRSMLKSLLKMQNFTTYAILRLKVDQNVAFMRRRLRCVKPRYSLARKVLSRRPVDCTS